MLLTDEMQKHLDKGMYGQPLVNPDEQHKYMGTFRERCYLSMTLAQMKEKDNQDNLRRELAKDPDAQVLMNGQLSERLQGEYIQLLTKSGHKFTIVNDFVGTNPDSLGLLVVSKEAVNEPVIDIDQKYPEKEAESAKSTKKKPGFFDRLFHPNDQ